MPLAFVTLNKAIVDLGTFKSEKKKVLSLNPSTSDSDAGVDLMFEEENEHEISLWENAILEVQEIHQSKANRLKQAKDEITRLEAYHDLSDCSVKILKTKSSEEFELNRTLEKGKR